MHELPLTKSIFKAVMKKADEAHATHINRVVLEIGVLHDFIPEYVQRYWDFIARDTIADGSAVEIIDLDGLAECGQCGNQYAITRQNMLNPQCPDCSHPYGRMLKGNELRIKGIEIVRAQG